MFLNMPFSHNVNSLLQCLIALYHCCLVRYNVLVVSFMFTILHQAVAVRVRECVNMCDM